MRKVLLSFEVYVSQETDNSFFKVEPNFLFQGEFDKDDEKSFSSMCDLENKVKSLCRCFSNLGCLCSVTCKEISNFDFV